MNRIRSTALNLLALALVALAALAPARATADVDTWLAVSDIGVVTLVAASVGVPLAEDDGPGAWQAAGSFAVASVVTEGLKAVVSKERPDGSDDHSFPSGHTARSFASATTLCVRQGPGIGIPALAVAGLVGVARVEGDKHYWIDVITGAVIGVLSGLLVTDEPADDASVALDPWVTTDAAGISALIRF